MTRPITPDGLEEILYNFALTLLRTRQTIEPVGSITFAEAKTAINQYMLDTFMELLEVGHTSDNDDDLLDRLRKAAKVRLKP